MLSALSILSDFPSPDLTFSGLSVSLTPSKPSVKVIPVGLDLNVQPLTSTEATSFIDGKTTVAVSGELKDLYSLGMFARVFQNDDEEGV